MGSEDIYGYEQSDDGFCINIYDGLVIMHLEYPIYPIFNRLSGTRFLTDGACKNKADRCRRFRQSSITIANAALAAIQADSLRSYGDGK